MKAFERKQFYALGEYHPLLIREHDVTDYRTNSGLDTAILAVEIIEALGPQTVNRGSTPRYTAFDLGLIFEMGRIQGMREAVTMLAD